MFQIIIVINFIILNFILKNLSKIIMIYQLLQQYIFIYSFYLLSKIWMLLNINLLLLLLLLFFISYAIKYSIFYYEFIYILQFIISKIW